ncbi:hypothetical protein RFI_17753 [Reticulomyxa filosa]|uniref:Uncharacterized protein n=1 Tax=Reticulomyxa filosa TaxID=46433 RepID=X6N188_RETFI|nr:hypothetical protein RFI_17753 [Reticulomyxa filosa]|eukprot:ETO19479.1 hypothetical protein RFI_17753 [Reticulomyxa filosa]
MNVLTTMSFIVIYFTHHFNERHNCEKEKNKPIKFIVFTMQIQDFDTNLFSTSNYASQWSSPNLFHNQSQNFDHFGDTSQATKKSVAIPMSYVFQQNNNHSTFTNSFLNVNPNAEHAKNGGFYQDATHGFGVNSYIPTNTMKNIPQFLCSGESNLLQTNNSPNFVQKSLFKVLKKFVLFLPFFSFVF